MTVFYDPDDYEEAEQQADTEMGWDYVPGSMRAHRSICQFELAEMLLILTEIKELLESIVRCPSP